MNMSKTLSRGLAVTVSVVALLFLFAACGEEPAPEPTPTPVLTGLLTSAGEKLAALSTAKISMVDEKESGAKFFLTTFKSMKADIEAPNSFWMLVNAEAPVFGFVEIEMMAVGEEAFMKFSKDAPWAPMPLDQVPFNFSGLGPTLRDVMYVIRDGDGAIAGIEEVMGSQATRVEGSILSEQLSNLITSVDPGHQVTLTLWIGEADHLLKQVMIAGQIYNADAPETVRLLTIEGIDVPVEIELPEIASGQ